MAGHHPGSPVREQHPGVLVTGLGIKEPDATHEDIIPWFAWLGGLFQLPFQLQLLLAMEMVLNKIL